MKKIFSIFIFSWPLLTFGSGGSVVGNGAGLSEQNIIYAFNNLIDSIDNCLSNNSICKLTDSEVLQIKLIRKVRIIEANKKDPIQFISEKMNPNFFELSMSEPHRIAKTGLTPDDVIWFNSDLLYNDQGQPAIDFPLATALLIHEIGHQSGATDHAFLDSIGSKVRSALEQKSMTYDYDSENSQFAIQIYNFDNLTLRSQVFFSVLDSKQFLTPEVNKTLKCSDQKAQLVGFEIWNGHWDVSTNENGLEIIPFKAWVRYSCLLSGVITNEKSNLRIDFSNSNLHEVRFLRMDFFD